MSKVAHYLQEHLTGEVVSSAGARRFFSTDGSVLAITPNLVVYPRNENDVRKTARFTWQLAERGRVIALTPRGLGTSTSGAALGEGIILSFPAHMHKILELDNKSGDVTVEPGITYGKLQQTLHTHDRFLPPYPPSLEYSTIGGAVGDNTSGEKSVKYGDTRAYVHGLRVVVANGELLQTGRMNKRELNKKLGLATFEGEIYRAIDALLEENHEFIQNSGSAVTKNTAGYELSDVRRKDGSFDLTPLLVGSQGTLGIITEVTLGTEPYNPTTSLITASFESVSKAQKAIVGLRELPEMPSAIEMVDSHFLEMVESSNPNQLKNLVSKPFPKVMLFVEFDSPSERSQKRLIKKAQKLLDKLDATCQVGMTPEEQEKFWRIRYATSTVVGYDEGNTKAVPVIDDGIVPPEHFQEYLEGLYAIFEHAHLQPAVWGHAGDGHLHVQPLLDLSQVGDRQKVFRLMEEHYELITKLKGSIAGSRGDGRVRAPYTIKQYDPKMYEFFQKVKQIFDPYGTMNPGVKINVSLDSVKALLRSTYALDHLHNHLPHS
jgi:FAD/FMN-containing dehydrogenase